MNVYVERGVTQKWVDAMGMRARKKENGFRRDFTWLKVGFPYFANPFFLLLNSYQAGDLVQ